MTKLTLGREARRPMARAMIKPYPLMDNDQEFIDALFSALEERDRQIQRLLRLLQEKRLMRQSTDARVDEAC
jgi:hypothetical protein